MKQIANWLHMALRLSAAVMMGSMMTLAVAQPHTMQQPMPVQANVSAVAKIQSNSSPALVPLARSDLSRRAVTVRNASRLTIYTNERAGYQIKFMLSPDVESIEVDGLEKGKAVLINAQSAPVPRIYPVGGTEVLTLGYKLNLAPSVRSASIPWPVTVVLIPL